MNTNTNANEQHPTAPHDLGREMGDDKRGGEGIHFSHLVCLGISR